MKTFSLLRICLINALVVISLVISLAGVFQIDEGLTGYTPPSKKMKQEAARRRQVNRIILPEEAMLENSTIYSTSILE